MLDTPSTPSAQSLEDDNAWKLYALILVLLLLLTGYFWRTTAGT
jgi:hypothetical protein